MAEEQVGLRRRSPTGVEGLEAASGTKSSGGASEVCAHVTCSCTKRDWGEVTRRMGSAELQGGRKRGRGPSTEAPGAGVPALSGV